MKTVELFLDYLVEQEDREEERVIESRDAEEGYPLWESLQGGMRRIRAAALEQRKRILGSQDIAL